VNDVLVVIGVVTLFYGIIGLVSWSLWQLSDGGVVYTSRSTTTYRHDDGESRRAPHTRRRRHLPVADEGEVERGT